LWLPGSQTQLALVTADFVKIYDLSLDALSPQYFFLVPSGKIRDCTFVCTEVVMHFLNGPVNGFSYLGLHLLPRVSFEMRHFDNYLIFSLETKRTQYFKFEHR
jgi:hypothetical protein